MSDTDTTDTDTDTDTDTTSDSEEEDDSEEEEEGEVEVEKPVQVQEVQKPDPDPITPVIEGGTADVSADPPPKAAPPADEGPTFTDEEMQNHLQWFTYATGLDEDELLSKLEANPPQIRFGLELKRPQADEWAQDVCVYAAAKKFERAFAWLMKRRRLIFPQRYSSKALRMACAAGSVKIVKALLRDGRSEPNARSNQALIQSCKEGHTQIVKMLLGTRRVDPSDKGGQALIFAANFGKHDIVKLLLKHDKVDPASMDFAAVQQAAAKGYENIVREILFHRKMRNKLCQIVRK